MGLRGLLQGYLYFLLLTIDSMTDHDEPNQIVLKFQNFKFYENLLRYYRVVSNAQTNGRADIERHTGRRIDRLKDVQV
jgi:predicted GNAT superfamily acetyltransferase